MLFKTKKCKRYSESFKSQVLNEVLSGLNSISEIRKKYNLGTMTISRWMASEGIASGINLIDVPLPSGMKSSKEVHRLIRVLQFYQLAPGAMSVGLYIQKIYTGGRIAEV